MTIDTIESENRHILTFYDFVYTYAISVQKLFLYQIFDKTVMNNGFFTSKSIVVILAGSLSILGTGIIDEIILNEAFAPIAFRFAPPTITGENVYVTWWTNNTANNNDEVLFRASTDGGVTFGEKINLSNSNNTNSTRAEIASDADSVVVTWWESNQTSETPVMRVSDDNGETFGPPLILAVNGTIGVAATE